MNIEKPNLPRKLSIGLAGLYAITKVPSDEPVKMICIAIVVIAIAAFQTFLDKGEKHENSNDVNVPAGG